MPSLGKKSMIKYPNGTKQIVTAHEKKERKIKIASANLGMDFEDEINQTLAFYKDEDICLMTKRPTPINIVKVDYSHGAKIIDAYFEAQSTTDYNGVYKGRYIDFEAKSTHLNASIPLHNITPHQVEHLKMVKRQGGVAFFLISFIKHDEVYLLDASVVITYFDEQKRKSIPYEVVKKEGVLIKKDYIPRLHIIEAIEQCYFKK